MASTGVIFLFILPTFFVFHRFEIFVGANLNVPSATDTRNGHQNNSSAAHLNTPSDVIIRVGERLELNCSIVRTMNSSSQHLSWYYGEQRLTNRTNKLNNDTLQLVIENVSWSNNGTYICKEIGSSNVLPKHVLVRVGDIPSSPRNVWINNVELRTVIHWTPPTVHGGLPLRYVVKGQCKNVSRSHIPYCDLESFTLCESSRVISNPGSNTLECVANGYIYEHFVIYDAFVEARNALGASRSDPVEFKANLINPLLTTPDPKPSMSFSAKEGIPAGSVDLSWNDAKQLRFWTVRYTILYHKEGDSHNKTLILHSPRTNTLIQGLSGFSLYHFYLLVQYGMKQGNTTTYGTFSHAAVQTVKTKILAPSQPPMIVNCSRTWSNLRNSVRLDVRWNLPPPESLNGPLANMSLNISYRCQKGSHETDYSAAVSNTTAWSVNIPAWQHYERCSVWLRTCNGLFCSAISNPCVVGGFQDNSAQPPSTSTVAIVVGTLCGVLLVIVVVLCFRSKMRHRNGERRTPLADVLRDLLPPAHQYDEIDEPPDNHDYHEVIM